VGALPIRRSTRRSRPASSSRDKQIERGPGGGEPARASVAADGRRGMAERMRLMRTRRTLVLGTGVALAALALIAILAFGGDEGQPTTPAPTASPDGATAARESCRPATTCPSATQPQVSSEGVGGDQDLQGGPAVARERDGDGSADRSAEPASGPNRNPDHYGSGGEPSSGPDAPASEAARGESPHSSPNRNPEHYGPQGEPTTGPDAPSSEAARESGASRPNPNPRH
jgi:hypothetical protein